MSPASSSQIIRSQGLTRLWPETSFPTPLPSLQGAAGGSNGVECGLAALDQSVGKATGGFEAKADHQGNVESDLPRNTEHVRRFLDSFGESMRHGFNIEPVGDEDLMDFWVPLGSALLGTLIGAATTIGTMIVQAQRDAAKHRQDAALQLALADFAQAVDLAKTNGPTRVPPIAIYLAYHLKALALAEKGTLTIEDFGDLAQFRDALKQVD